MPSENISQVLDTYLCAQQEVDGFMGSVLVVKGEEVLLSKGYGKANLEHDIDNTPDTRFRIASISKQFTGAAILKLQEQGLLDVHASLATYLPTYPRGNDITLHDVLTHSAGVPNFTSFEDYRLFKKQHTTLEELVNRFKDLPLEFEPGTKHNYSNSGYILLAHVIEEISKKSYGESLKEHFFEPYGLTHTGEEIPGLLISKRASGYGYGSGEYWNAEYIDMTIPKGAGNLYSTTQDLHRWMQQLYQGHVLKAESLEAMKKPLILPDGTNTGYGYGIYFGKWEEQAIGHNGGIDGFASSAFYFPERDMTITVLCNVETCNADVILGSVKDIVFGKDVPLPVKPVAITLDSSIMARYLGDYELRPNFILTIRLSENRLMAQATGQSEFELFASSETEFFTDFNAGATFTLENGKVNGLIWHQGGHDTTAQRLETKS